MIEIKGMRWTASRKAELVEAVARGEITEAQLAALEMSPDELAHWQRLYEKGGKGALRATRLQSYRALTSKPGKRRRKRDNEVAARKG